MIRPSTMLFATATGFVWFMSRVNAFSLVMSATSVILPGQWILFSLRGSRFEQRARLQLPTIYTGPYSYDAAPAESVFAALKLGELNPERLPTGKRALSDIADMVGARLASIRRSVRVRYWHRAVLGLFGYLYFEKI